MNQYFENMLAAAIVACVLGIVVGPFVVLAAPDPRPPRGITSEAWLEAVNRAAVGDWIGFFERLLATVAFWTGELTVIGAWFAFKVAAKWETWKNVVQFPTKLTPHAEKLEELRARNEVGAWLMGRFLLGTVTNVAIGVVAAFVGQRWVTVSASLGPRISVAFVLVVLLTRLAFEGWQWRRGKMKGSQDIAWRFGAPTFTSTLAILFLVFT